MATLRVFVCATLICLLVAAFAEGAPADAGSSGEQLMWAS